MQQKHATVGQAVAVLVVVVVVLIVVVAVVVQVVAVDVVVVVTVEVVVQLVVFGTQTQRLFDISFQMARQKPARITRVSRITTQVKPK